jgi:hypothetical protein|tara:strand:- start:668 stop:901 length:234 start_codon:yes stop_codon:yes gene_type:complete
MTLDETFKIESILDKRKTGYDVLEFLDTKYFSKSKQKYIRYGDMHLQHFIRIFQNKGDEIETIGKALNEAVTEIFKK